MTAYTKPLPRPTDVDNAPYWLAARNGVLECQCCGHCGRFRFPAAPICPFCRSRGARWKALSGRGVVESFCRFHKAYWPAFAADLPYLVVQVRLDEGVRLYSNLIDVPDDQVRIGLQVEASFEAVTTDVTLVKFRLAAPAGA